MFKIGENCNVRFHVGTSREMVCRKEVLAGISPVFFKMFYGPDKEDCEKNSKLIDVDPYAFEMFLEFAYYGKIEGIEPAAHSKDVTKETKSSDKETKSVDKETKSVDKETKLSDKNLRKANACRFCVHWRRFLEKFYELCYCAQKYSVPSFQKYCVAIVGEYPNIPDELLLSVYSGASLVKAERLIEKCEEQIQKNPLYFLHHSSINKINVDSFCHLIAFLIECYYHSKDDSFYKDLFVALDKYAAINYTCSKWDKKEREGKEKIKELFNKLLQDDRLTQLDFIRGPALSTFLKDEESVKVLERFHA